MSRTCPVGSRRPLSAPPSGRARYPEEPAITLLELLVVMSILGVLMAMGVGGYTRMLRGAELRGYRGRLQSVLRHARNTTIYEGAPAGVFVEEVGRVELRDPMEHVEGEIIGEKDGILVLDVKGRARAMEVPRERIIRIERVRRVRSVGFRTAGAWHLEESDPSAGYLGRRCRLAGGEPYFGKVGTAVLLNPPGERKGEKIVAVPAPDDSSDPFRLPEGGRIELWAHALRPALADGFLLRRKGSYELKVTRDGKITGGVGAETLDVERYCMPFNRWVKLTLSFGAEYVEISVNDVVRARVEREGGTLDPPEKGELVFGEYFSGVIDEIRVQRRVEGEAFDLPEVYELTGPGATIFDHRGRLDPAVHTAPVRFELSKGEKSMSVSVAVSGRIE